MNMLSREFAAALVVGSLLLAGQALAQTPAVTPVVPLASGACPTVSAGGTLSLDWNPDFSPESAVAGIRHFTLAFAAATGPGGTVLSHPNGDVSTFALRATVITPLANGFYHFEFQTARRIAPGAYLLVNAGARPALAAGYQGPRPEMIVSPASQSFCFQVEARSLTTQSTP